MYVYSIDTIIIFGILIGMFIGGFALGYDAGKNSKH